MDNEKLATAFDTIVEYMIDRWLSGHFNYGYNRQTLDMLFLGCDCWECGWKLEKKLNRMWPQLWVPG